jgi:hypothetical protein
MMTHVWCAFAGGEGTTEEHLIGIYTSRTKAKRAVLDFWEIERGRWTCMDGNALDPDMLDPDAYGYVSRRPVQ